MQGVKKIILINLLLFFGSTLSSQEVIGSYKLMDHELAIADVGVTYNFRKNGTFEHIVHEHLEGKSISGGNYHLTGDTLTLEYQELGTNIQGEVKIKKREKLNSSDILSSRIKVFNSEGTAQPGVNLLMLNKEKKLVTGFSSNGKGEFLPISVYDNYIQFLTFSFLAHNEISIHTDTLFGYMTEIEVYLKDSSPTFINAEKTIKFLIKSSTSESMELQPLNGTGDKFLKLKKS